MPVSVLSVVLDADWEVAAAFSKITICEIELFTLLTILNITGRKAAICSYCSSSMSTECWHSAILLLSLCPSVFLPHRAAFDKKALRQNHHKLHPDIAHLDIRTLFFPPMRGPLCERGQAVEIKWERWCKKGERRKKQDREDDWEYIKRGETSRRKTGTQSSQEKNEKRKVVMDVKQSQVETRPKQINAKTARQFTLSMSGELGFSSSMPEGLRGSNTGSGW